MKKALIAFATLLVLGLAAFAWSNYAEPAPAPVLDSNGEILSDPINEIRAEYLAPEPDNITFD